MITPQRALVRPRIISPDSGENLLLEDFIAAVLEGGKSRIIQIQGGPGSGKTTALAHLAACQQLGPSVDLLDDPSPADVLNAALARHVVFASRQRFELANVRLSLAPWTPDELLEFVLAADPKSCAAVLPEIQADSDSAKLRGNPALWRAVLQEFLAEPQASSVREAVQRSIDKMLPTSTERRFGAEFCLAILRHDEQEAHRTLTALAKHESDFERYRLLRLPFVQQLLGGECVMSWLQAGAERAALSQSLPQPLIDELGRLIRDEPAVGQKLRELAERGPRLIQPQAATLVFSADPSWRPREGHSGSLAGGSFPRAAWAGLQMPFGSEGGSSFSNVNLVGADLCHSILDGNNFRDARLANSRFTYAKIVGIQASRADLTGADLAHVEADRANFQKATLHRTIFDDASLIGIDFDDADLTEASFCRANLTYSVFLGCKIGGADFRGANLKGCILRGLVLREAEFAGVGFPEADLSGCDLEGLRLERVNFQGAKLKNTWLTGTVMTRGNFQNANLRGAGLAEISWENADLRGANLKGVTFHMGSTRCGLVGSPYPGHGSKTGFYTDDYYDQSHKHPEEIRKANLCGADLRGAKIENVDFYLVDLRGARFDRAATEHLTRCGAILADR